MSLDRIAPAAPFFWSARRLWSDWANFAEGLTDGFAILGVNLAFSAVLFLAFNDVVNLAFIVVLFLAFVAFFITV
jgi:hypothetical protein